MVRSLRRASSSGVPNDYKFGRSECGVTDGIKSAYGYWNPTVNSISLITSLLYEIDRKIFDYCSSGF